MKSRQSTTDEPKIKARSNPFANEQPEPRGKKCAFRVGLDATEVVAGSVVSKCQDTP
jgi:hypothetical protein